MNQCSFETVNYTWTGEWQSVNYYSFFPQCVNKEGADINIPSQSFILGNILTLRDVLGLIHLQKIKACLKTLANTQSYYTSPLLNIYFLDS